MMTEVLIVGGGVFGLSTALSLARGKYRDRPEKILVIGPVPKLAGRSGLLQLTFLDPYQIDLPIRQKKMPLVRISTRSFGLITPIPFMQVWLSKR